MRLAILGGSFNPVHVGHLALADTVLSDLSYDRIVLIPSFQTPLKDELKGSRASDRLDMLLASIPADPRITVEDCEIRREGVSYTIDTIDYIIDRYRPGGKPALVIGDDLAADFSRWKRADEVAEKTDIVLARRLSEHSVPFAYPHRSLSNELIRVSSGMVREAIRKGASWRYLVPRGARFIIEERELYGYKGRVSPVLCAEIEDAARTALSPGRFIHSRNTALLAYDLSVRYGLEPWAAYAAGIGHDMAKGSSEEELLALAARDGRDVGDLERKKPSLLHGRAAAVLLEERFGIHNKDILDAVRFHTTGNSRMGPLAKVVYIADKIEASRENVTPGLREYAASADLDALFAAVLNDTVAYLRSREMVVSEGTLRLLSAIQKKGEL